LDNNERIKSYKKKYCEDNKNEIEEYNKRYREDNKEEIQEYSKQYRKDNRGSRSAKVKCDCGCDFFTLNLSKHKKTKKHINLINQM
jgi:phage-related tail protein